jgi:hypothetical protein
MWIALFAVFTMLVGTAAADDIAPPSWRGDDNTSWVQWEFSTDANPPMYDAGVLPWGDPQITVTPGCDCLEWIETHEGRQGVWPLSGEIDVVLENDPVERPYKDVWVQVTWLEQVSGAVPRIEVLDPYYIYDDTPLFYEADLGDGWHHSVFHLPISPNPAQETLKISGAIYVDELVIDTQCAPEPTALGLILFGGMAALARRRRR